MKKRILWEIDVDVLDTHVVLSTTDEETKWLIQHEDEFYFALNALLSDKFLNQPNTQMVRNQIHQTALNFTQDYLDKYCYHKINLKTAA